MHQPTASTTTSVLSDLSTRSLPANFRRDLGIGVLCLSLLSGCGKPGSDEPTSAPTSGKSTAGLAVDPITATTTDEIAAKVWAAPNLLGREKIFKDLEGKRLILKDIQLMLMERKESGQLVLIADSRGYNFSIAVPSDMEKSLESVRDHAKGNLMVVCTKNDPQTCYFNFKLEKIEFIK